MREIMTPTESFPYWTYFQLKHMMHLSIASRSGMYVFQTWNCRGRTDCRRYAVIDGKLWSGPTKSEPGRCLGIINSGPSYMSGLQEYFSMCVGGIEMVWGIHYPYMCADCRYFMIENFYEDDEWDTYTECAKRGYEGFAPYSGCCSDFSPCENYIETMKQMRTSRFKYSKLWNEEVSLFDMLMRGKLGIKLPEGYDSEGCE